MAPNVAVNTGTPADGGLVLLEEVVLLSDDALVGRGVVTEALTADIVVVSTSGVALLHKSPSQHVNLQEQ